MDHISSAQGAARAWGGDLAARRPVDTMNADQQTFADHRNLLFSIAYRILGSAADAEDVVQDAWFKWSADDRSQVSDPKAYLARIVSNLSMERLRSTRRQARNLCGTVASGADPDRGRRRRGRRGRRIGVDGDARRAGDTQPPRARGVRAQGGVRLQLRRNRRSRRAFRVGGAPGGSPRTRTRPGPAAPVREPTASRSAKPPSGSSPRPPAATSTS